MILDVLLSPRFKSFYWRTGMMALAGFLAILADSLEMFQLSGTMIAMLGLILGEISKAVTNAVDSKPLGFSR